MVIAIDGLSSCGKSSMAKQLAKTLGYIYVDTGAMYRAVTLFALRNEFIGDGYLYEDKLVQAFDNGIEISFDNNGNTLLNGENVEGEIRGLKVLQYVAQISAIAYVRKVLVDCQRLMGADKNIVMDGRDIGTVVFPNADLKVFVTASAAIRAQRRYDELVAKGIPASYDDILGNVKQRDYSDRNRKESPLKLAEDAVLLDNGDMTIDEQNAWLLNEAQKACVK